jgi:hypothetical protein
MAVMRVMTRDTPATARQSHSSILFLDNREFTDATEVDSDCSDCLNELDNPLASVCDELSACESRTNSSCACVSKSLSLSESSLKSVASLPSVCKRRSSSFQFPDDAAWGKSDGEDESCAAKEGDEAKSSDNTRTNLHTPTLDLSCVEWPVLPRDWREPQVLTCQAPGGNAFP